MIAQKFEEITPFKEANFGTTTTIGEIISKVLEFVFPLAGILILVYLIAGGFQLMLAGGEPKKVQGAWGKITNAILGFVIIFIAYWVTKLIGQIFGIQIILDIFS